jgi:hypothetical protein
MDSYEKFDRWLESNEMPPHLASEMQYYLHEIERDYTMTLREGIMDWYDRDSFERGWLKQKDRRYIREGLVASGIAVPMQPDHEFSSMTKKERLWFQMDGIKVSNGRHQIRT